MKKYLLLAACLWAMGCKTVSTTTTTNNNSTNNNTGTTTAVVTPKTEPVYEPIDSVQKMESPMNPNLPMPTATAEMPIVVIETDYGKIEILLFDKTPQHRDNFIKLVKEGYYDGMLFHRVINKFMVQGGDPDSKTAAAGQQLGMGGPGYTIPAEFVREYIHIKGAIAAARTGDAANPQKRSSGSQFYIVQGTSVQKQMLDVIQSRYLINYTEEERQLYQTVGGTPHLDTQYTVFGRVVSGLDVLDKIAAEPVAPGDRPLKDLKMKVYVKE